MAGNEDHRICLPSMDAAAEPWTLENYLAQGGYRAWQQVLEGRWTREAVIDEVKASGLRGRGGAGFPTGLKWSFMPRDKDIQKYFVCNSDESEPGTCHDREILRYNPHSIIEGMAIGGYAMGATVGYNYIRGEFLGDPVVRFEAAVREAYEAGWLGRNLHNSGIDYELHTFVGAGAYICGEETALLESLEGKPGKPRFKPPFPANYGLYGAPTTINNTQTVALVPAILRNGAQWFADLGVERAGGTAIFSVSGHVGKARQLRAAPGHSVPRTARHRRRRARRTAPQGGDSRRIVGAGAAGGHHRRPHHGLRYDPEGGFGAGYRCGDHHGRNHLHGERAAGASPGSISPSPAAQCTPCREGTGWLYRVLTRITEGKGRQADLDMLVDVANKIEGHTICALGDAAAWPVQSFMKHFRHEFEYMIEHGGRSIVEQLDTAA